MATDPGKKFAEMAKQTQAMFTFNPMMAPQLEQFWKAQNAILDEAEAFSRSWFERRHEATKSALEAIRRSNGDSGNPETAMQEMANWQRHSMERLSEDMQDWFQLCTRCAGSLAASDEASTKQDAQSKPAAKSK